jgi:hypothetical protein
MTELNVSDDDILALARLAGLPVRPPYSDEIVRSARALLSIANRLPDSLAWSDDPAFKFVAEDVLKERP